MTSRGKGSTIRYVHETWHCSSMATWVLQSARHCQWPSCVLWWKANERELLAMDACGELSECGRSHAVPFKAYTNMRTIVDQVNRFQGDDEGLYQAAVVPTGSIGRPSFDIPCSQLDHLLNNRFTVPEIANLIGVSVSTIRRSMSIYQLSVRETYTQLGDDELDRMVSDAQLQYLSWGNRLMYSYILSCGVRVQFHRVREIQACIDPVGSFMRRLSHLQRRRYAASGIVAHWWQSQVNKVSNIHQSSENAVAFSI